MAVVIPFESPQSASIERLASLVAADMERGALVADALVIRLVLDNSSAHISKETRRYLATRPQRFVFVFTPTHGSWLNLIEVLFSKLTRSLLRGIRVASKAELIERLHQYFRELNQEPVVFRWKYKMDEISIG